MRFERLADWLNWQETLHPSTIDLGLERVAIVLRKLGWQPPHCPVITIAGTKGKGSCVAILESIYSAAGYRVGSFTSPHLRRYTERIHIANREISATELCVIFERIEAARVDTSLTYFEFNTIAALLAFESANLDAWILEVGMGGRLDAVNVVDADVALVTSIGLDHTEWLGTDLNSIAREKAGIFRSGKPALFGSSDMPKAIAHQASAVGAELIRSGHDFGHSMQTTGWTWWMQGRQLTELPIPGIAGAVQLDNASSALAIVQLLAARLPVKRTALNAGLQKVTLPGRFQVVAPSQLMFAKSTEWVLDVAHNTLSAQVLAGHLASRERKSTLAILGVMADKDLDGIVAALSAQVDLWLPVSLPGPRGLSAAVLSERLRALVVQVCATAETLEQACQLAMSTAGKQGVGRILVCGSFMTVGPVLDWLGL